MITWRPKWTERVACKIGMCLLAPKTKQSYLFLAPLQWPWQGCCCNLPRESNAVRRSCVSPTLQTLQTLPLPRPLAFVRFDPPALSGSSDQRRIRGCGIRWLLAGPDSLPLWLCVSMVYVLLCCWGVFPVLTLYSPRSIVWGLFFSPHFPHVMLYFSSILLAFHYWLYSVWLCMWRIIKNLEP